MKILGLDYGHKRIGLAYADELGVAFPIVAAVEPTFEQRLAHIGDEIKNRKIDMLLVGYPYNMDGTVGSKAKEVDDFIAVLKEKFGLPIEISDERLSSFQAENDLSNFSKKKKSLASIQKHRRSGDIDSRAIALVLQDYIDDKGGML